MEWVEEALEIALRAIDNENFHDNDDQSCTTKVNNLKIYQNDINDEDKIIDDMKTNEKCTTKNIIKNLHNSKENFEPIYENLNEMIIIGNSKIEQNVIESSSSPSSTTSSPSTSSSSSSTTTDMSKNQIHLEEQQIIQTRNQNVKIYSDDHQRDYVNQNGNVVKHANHEAKIEELKSEVEQKEKENKENYVDNEPYYQVPKSSEPLYEVPKYQKPVPVYENIEIFYSDLTTIVNGNTNNGIDNEENQIEIENYHQLNGLVTTSSTSTSSLSSSSSSMLLQPPKEKPPPPPIEEISDNENEIESLTQSKTASSSLSTSSLSPIKQDNTNQQQQSLNNLKITEESINIVENVGNKQNPVKRMNSTKRIKKELRNKRSSFLGIEGNDDDIFLELTVAPPPDMAQLLQEERRLEKQLYMKAGLYDSSDTGESRDSGVSENHSRQSSEPFTNSSEEHEDLLVKKEKEIIEVLEKEEKKQRISSENWSKQEENDAKIQCIENQIREQEEVLRVERELLQLEQEELKRQRENLMIRENMARRELEHGAKMLMSATTNHNRSLQDINNASSSTTTTTATTNHYANIPNQIYRVEADYRKSMSDLPSDLLFNSKRIPPTPPAKPLRSNLSIDSRILNANGNTNNNNKNNNTTVGLIKIANVSNNQMITGSSGRIQHSQSTDEFVPLRNYQPSSALHHGNMTRHTLHALSATPKPKYTDGWVQATIKNKSSDKCVDNWLSYQQKRKSIPDGFNYNKHWLIQEAEQRRIDQQRGLRSSSISISTNSINGWANTNGNSAIQRNGNITNDKPLPDAVIQTITQRVQSKGLGERKRLDQTPPTPPLPAMAASDSLLTTVTAPPPPPPPPVPASATTEVGQQDKILSVSGKKKCSHCGEELGRGAAMIIESLRLFYHINCFKCCVCHVQLGDGLNGTDVRVRNHKLHCHNCYSSDDGIKFSCV